MRHLGLVQQSWFAGDVCLRSTVLLVNPGKLVGICLVWRVEFVSVSLGVGDLFDVEAVRTCIWLSNKLIQEIAFMIFVKGCSIFLNDYCAAITMLWVSIASSHSFMK